MIGLMIAVLAFNSIAYKVNKVLNKNQIVHIWMFTLAFQLLFDLYTDVGYHAYWYFSKDDVDWESLIHILFLVPPVNIIFLNYYPYDKSIYSKIGFVFLFNIIIVIYEWVALLKAPWGYFHYGWWTLWYSFMINPLLLFLLIKYFNFVKKIEKAI
ncbi:CBO0543 family protein [Bacillus sp. B1-b2]|uniref:CBO0543 family protein n=1 Tax=Bacillus sp. B1-b2 TaxID=2653201 RepID=UPI001261AC1D|nr:CBO0543 family protein [Bacillus sp. B1-b2]KAB7672016.1 hypothetical protein F9279_03580 [Bacillus sp. B1-b2]